MHLKLSSRTTLAGMVCLGISVLPAHALVSLNDGKDKLYVTGKATFGWDSNLFANSDSKGDFTTSMILSAEYARRAGLIGVDASVAVSSSRYSKYTSENFNNPSFHLEFTKQTGRTTGSLLLGAARESRADSAANMRSVSWNYQAALNLKYPVIERYSLSGGVGMNQVKYQSDGGQVDSTSINANADLFYVYTTERDLTLGYRFRRSRSSVQTSDTDHALSFGVSGRILPKLNGSVRGGLQTRISDGLVKETFNSWMANANVTWNLNKKSAITGSLSKDFNITSTNISTDTFAASLIANYAYSAKWSLSASTGVGQSTFLGLDGLGRVDTYFNYGLDLNYSMNDHLKINASYVFMKNWSAFAAAEFTRSAYMLSVSSRW
jgi:Putative beta-barrel porin 2